MNNTDVFLQDKFIRMKLADIRHSKGYTQKRSLINAVSQYQQYQI